MVLNRKQVTNPDEVMDKNNYSNVMALTFALSSKLG